MKQSIAFENWFATSGLSEAERHASHVTWVAVTKSRHKNLRIQQVLKLTKTQPKTIAELAAEIGAKDASLRALVSAARSGGDTTVLRIADWQEVDGTHNYRAMFARGPGDDAPMPNRLADRIYELTRSGPMLICDIARELQTTVPVAQNAITRLRAAKKMRIAERTRAIDPNHGNERRLYGHGSEPDAPPLPPIAPEKIRVIRRAQAKAAAIRRSGIGIMRAAQPIIPKTQQKWFSVIGGV